MFYVFSFPPGVYVGTFNLIVSIPGPSILTLNIFQNEMMSFIQQYSINEDLISEIEKLQEENKRLKRIF